MRKYRVIFAIMALFIATSSMAQWSTSSGVVSLNTNTNSVLVGPAASTQGNFHVNNTATSITNVNIENNVSGTSHTTALKFLGRGMNFQLYNNTFPACGGGAFHMAPIGSAGSILGIHFTGARLLFSENGAYGGCGPSYTLGKFLFEGNIGTDGLAIGYNTSVTQPPTGFSFSNSGNSYVAGKLAIGTTQVTNSSYKLYVGGIAICEEMKVQLQASWPDYVFEKDYQLKPLSEVKEYIAENKHLPEVPTASEIQKDGIPTGQMLNVQMKKIEELTLYLIQMEERLKTVESENKELKESIINSKK
jgi:hypothetical protein